MITDDTYDPDALADGEPRRQEAATVRRTWRGRDLLWTFSREAQFQFVRLPAAPLTDAQREALNRRDEHPEGSPERAAAAEEAWKLLKNRNTPRVRNAILSLWLMLHEPEDWNQTPEAPAFRAMVDRWSDEHFAEADANELISTLKLVDLVIEDAESTRAIPRPTGRTQENEAGN